MAAPVALMVLALHCILITTVIPDTQILLMTSINRTLFTFVNFTAFEVVHALHSLLL